MHYSRISLIAKCQYNCTRNVLWCQIHSLHIRANHFFFFFYLKNDNSSSSKLWGKNKLINRYMRNPTDAKAAHITSELPLYKVHLIKITGSVTLRHPSYLSASPSSSSSSSCRHHRHRHHRPLNVYFFFFPFSLLFTEIFH